jgi:cell division septal protein FtsQ
MKHLKRIIIVFLLLLSVWQVIYFWQIAPNMRLKKVFILANFDISVADILQILQIDYDTLMMSLNEKHLAERLEEHSMIESAEVQLGTWGHLRVQLEGRNPSMAVQNNEGRHFFVDSQGYILETHDSTGLFPIFLIGAEFERADDEQTFRLSASIRPLLSQLEQIRKVDRLLHSLIAQIVVHEIGERRVWMVSFIEVSGDAILDQTFNRQKLSVAYHVLRLLDEKGEKFRRIDLRTNEIVMISKENL